ncbi:TraM recognition domain-containing protein [Skermanella stibiiresistens]|nr:TraM recognition domain-containing protein [Skermanella stibiiresistens]
MIAVLKPVLGQLTSGTLGPMLSPDPTDPHDTRPITDLQRVIARRQVCYIGLDSLSDPIVGATIGSMLLADATSVAGSRYNFGEDLKPVNVLTDEAAETINTPLIQLLNKGRGAVIRVTIATQTIADFEARFASSAQARQVLGNCNQMVVLRVLDTETQQYVCETMPKVMIKRLQRSQGMSSGSSASNPLAFSGTASESLVEEEAELFPAALLGQLPNFEYLFVVGGTVLKGRIPFLRN